MLATLPFTSSALKTSRGRSILVPTQGLPVNARRRVRSRRHAAVGRSAPNSARTCTERAPRQGYDPAVGSPAAVSCGESRTAGTGAARRHPSLAARMLGLAFGPGGVAGACTAGRMHCMLGEVLAAVLIIVPLTTSVILVVVVVFGGTESSNRVFRLLRCIRDKEEPPAPGGHALKVCSEQLRVNSRRPIPVRQDLPNRNRGNTADGPLS
jgi:hypothetical protein